MKKSLYFVALFLCSGFFSASAAAELSSQIALEKGRIHNEEIASLKQLLREKYQSANTLSEEEYPLILEDIRSLRKEIAFAEENWRQTFADANLFSEEGCGLWDSGELTLADLIMDYGSVDYLYVIPPEILNLKLQIHSAIPIPRASWDPMLKVILGSNGIGVKPLGPYAKKLYILKQDLGQIEGICQKREELLFMEPEARAAFLCTPEPEQLKAVRSFFEKFSDPKETTVQVVGVKVVLISSRDSIEKLLNLYDAIWEKDAEKVVRFVHSKKIDVAAAEKILKAFFPSPGLKTRIPLHSQLSEDLIFLSVPQGLVLVGNRHAIERAETVLAELEGQLEDPYEMTVYWYSCKHSNPEDIADILSQVYESLVQTDTDKIPATVQLAQQKTSSMQKEKVSGKKTDAKQHVIDGNFIVDPKTGSILMVVRKDQIPKIKSLLQKIDVPKKMVQIDVLLVEKKLQDEQQRGINLLKIGSNVNRNASFIDFDGSNKGGGLLEFVFAATGKKYTPDFDLTYNFLMAQKDMKINANPSVLAVNQTPASISIVEEISLNNGAVILDSSTSNPRSETSFTRAQYGTILKMTPTIHYSGEEGDQGFVTLVTDITFDTTQSSSDNRPPVTKRSVKNEVTVADGETIIVGGLRRMTKEKNQEKTPFLGDLPGIGKFFGQTIESHMNTEMFIFITPRIIKHPIEDLRMIRKEELRKRAGDLPEFLQKISEAKEKEKQKVLADTLDLLFSKAA